MNKKLFFAAMSLAALTACTNDDFDSQNAAENVSPIQFEVINDGTTRASMDGNTIVWNANEGDLFTLYHGAAVGAVTGYQNATYKANANPGGTATLTSPSMILQGGAIMYWPVDTTFYTKSVGSLTIKIPADQTNIEHSIPYVSDQIEILEYAKYNKGTTEYNTAGLDRKYPVYMRPMASQLNLKVDYAGTDTDIASLYEGKPGVAAGEGIDEISVTSIELLTAAGTEFTKEVPVKFSDANAAWATKAPAHSNWKKVTDFDVAGIVAGGKTTKLTTTCLNGNDGCKFLILPQAKMTTDGEGVKDAAVVVKTNYGDVVVAKPGVAGTKYTATDVADAWYRFVKESTAAADGETKTTTKGTGVNAEKFKTTANIEMGLKQTINTFSEYKAPATLEKIVNEPMGTYLDRNVKVLLTKLDMSDLHVKKDKQLRDVARVWKKLGVANVTVYLDGGKEGNAAGEFKISQKTIEVINEVNNGGLGFQVKPCQKAGEVCNKIVITGSDYKQDVQDIAFITYNDLDESGTFTAGDFKATVVLDDEGTTKPWKWNGAVKVAANGVAQITNEGTMANATGATLQTKENNGTANNVKLVNDGTWEITGGVVKVQFDVTNNGTVNISKTAEYRQDGAGHIFINDATTLEKRFIGAADEQVGKVNNSGVFATVDNGTINNYGLIEHLENSAKTYITTNQKGGNFSADFSDANKMGRINLKYSNKDEDNISISATAPITQGFVSVTVDGDAGGTVLNNNAVGTYVNYIIVKRGIETITNLDAKIKYVEIDDQNDQEIAWALVDPTTATYDGLIVLSDVNIKLGTTIKVAKRAFLADDATMYVGGIFKIDDADPTPDGFISYYGDKHANFATNYVTF